MLSFNLGGPEGTPTRVLPANTGKSAAGCKTSRDICLSLRVLAGGAGWYPALAAMSQVSSGRSPTCVLSFVFFKKAKAYFVQL